MIIYCIGGVILSIYLFIKARQKQKKITKVYGMPWDETYCSLTLRLVQVTQISTWFLLLNAFY